MTHTPKREEQHLSLTVGTVLGGLYAWLLFISHEFAEHENTIYFDAGQGGAGPGIPYWYLVS